MPRSSLGDRAIEHGNGESNKQAALRQQAWRSAVASSNHAVEIETASRVPLCRGIPYIHGFLATLLLSCLSAAVPVVHAYGNIDFQSDVSRGITIGAAAAAAALIAIGRSPEVLFNVVLFFHIGVEATLVDEAIQYADRASDWDTNQTNSNTTRDDEDLKQGMSLTAASILLLHLLPFLFVDNRSVLVVCASAGLVVNVATAVFLHEESLLLVSGSAGALLVVVYIVCPTPATLWSQLRTSMESGIEGWLRC